MLISIIVLFIITAVTVCRYSNISGDLAFEEDTGKKPSSSRF